MCEISGEVNCGEECEKTDVTTSADVCNNEKKNGLFYWDIV